MKKEYLYRIVFQHSMSGNRVSITIRYYPDSLEDVTAWRLYYNGHPICTRMGKAGYPTIGYASRALCNILREDSADESKEICFYATEDTLRSWGLNRRK